MIPKLVMIASGIDFFRIGGFFPRCCYDIETYESVKTSGSPGKYLKLEENLVDCD
jgi:hypothetical protein